jgi:ribosomal protein S18 acetylase RimI-like enzyme
VPDPEVGDRLAPWFERQGWRVDRHVVMVQLRKAERDADLSVVRELREEDLRPARREVLSGHSWATEEVLDHIFAAKRAIGERVRARFFGAVVDGEVVSYSDLYQDGADAQIEDVGTLPERRDRGYASAVVLAAIEAARRDGAEFVCLVADANDWPKELYRRLGFDTVGHYTKFFVPGSM